ncbi:proline dehydrogenase family protein [Pedobacter sp. SYSU D00535]|uniref:proline dehydrogenase family protein n=1 Tax=Pedobacter sp. SYSU D00535 TaxID=2810308 RepID=UPI001A96EC29|nr:proline dehydrogenase family protein [Pedobacter sp. SYSU D00535]
MLNFDNTEIAFRGKSDKELNRAYWLFKMLSNGVVSKLGTSVASSALNVGLPVGGLIKNTVFSQFCGGESIEECEPTIEALDRGFVGSILDYSVEAVLNEEGFANTVEEIVQTIRRAKEDRRIPFAVFKPSALARAALLEKLGAGHPLTTAEHAEFFKVKGRINHICKTAYDHDVPVMMDAEESWIQDPIDTLAIEMMRLYNREKAIVYNTYQLYRTDKLASLKADVYLAETDGFILGAKLVRGAYMEKERARAEALGYASPIHATKDATDRDYNEGLVFCAAHLEHVALVAGTHNEASCLVLAELIKKKQLVEDHPHIYFAQLLGMSDNLSFNLAHEGYNAAKYVPYGPIKAVMPYLMRRAEENKAITGKMGRELALIAAERKRRSS